MNLGDRTVTIAYLGGPEDGWTRPYRRGDDPMPDLIAGYRLIGPHPYDPAVLIYRWVPLRTGRTHQCEAGSPHGCLGSRCPSGRQRAHA